MVYLVLTILVDSVEPTSRPTKRRRTWKPVRGCAYDRTVQRTGVVTAFNVVEGWVKDASKEVAREVLGRAMIEQLDFPSSTADFIETHTGEGVAGFVQS